MSYEQFGMYDYTAVVEELNECYGLNYIPNKERIELKKLKLAKYRDKSIPLGCVKWKLNYRSECNE